MNKTPEELQKIVASICKTLTEEQLNNLDLVSVLSHLLFSIGVSLEKCGDITSEEVLRRYANNPTLGNALMAQAMHMKETWFKPERNNKNERSERNI